MQKLPGFLKEYFWDVDFEKINQEKSKLYVIARLLDRGNDRAIKWLFKTYNKDSIKDVITNRRGFSARKANFWAEILDIDKRKVVCLQEPYRRMRQELWPY